MPAVVVGLAVVTALVVVVIGGFVPPPDFHPWISSRVSRVWELKMLVKNDFELETPSVIKAPFQVIRKDHGAAVEKLGITPFSPMAMILESPQRDFRRLKAAACGSWLPAGA